MQWHVIWDYRDALFNGFLVTVWLTTASIAGCFVLGTLVACVATVSGPLTKRLTGLYSDLLRNIPLVVKLFFFYFIFGLDMVPAALVAMILHESAYIADVMASGFRSIAREQAEGAYALGHTKGQVLRYVLVPQALFLVIPPLTNRFIEVLKNSAIVMLIAIEELTFQTQRIEHETFRGFEAASTVTVIYLLCALVIAGAMNLLQRRIASK